MSLDKLILIIVSVIAAAAATIWAGTAIFVGSQVNPITALAALSVVALCAYVAWRVISERLNSKEDHHYDRIEK